jgi:hypothetical protein
MWTTQPILCKQTVSAALPRSLSRLAGTYLHQRNKLDVLAYAGGEYAAHGTQVQSNEPSDKYAAPAAVTAEDVLTEEQLIAAYKEFNVPGYDGGKYSVRFHRRRGAALDMPEPVLAAYKEALVKLWRWKAQHGISQSAVAELFECIMPLVDPTVAAHLPRDYPTMLTHLESLGFEISGEVEYDICLMCYFVFRGEHADHDSCPKCNCPKMINGKRNPNIGILKYRPIWGHLQRLFKNKSVAEHMTYHSTAAAKLGDNNPESIVDVYDGIAWQKAMKEDARCVSVDEVHGCMCVHCAFVL